MKEIREGENIRRDGWVENNKGDGNDLNHITHRATSSTQEKSHA
jgi:hypothetical protein